MKRLKIMPKSFTGRLIWFIVHIFLKKYHLIQKGFVILNLNLTNKLASRKISILDPQILNKSHTLQGIWKTKQFERNKEEGQWKYIMKDVIFYEFIAVLESVRVKVVVKEVVGGEKYFWSVIPYWSIDKAGSRRILHSGYPDLD